MRTKEELSTISTSIKLVHVIALFFNNIMHNFLKKSLVRKLKLEKNKFVLFFDKNPISIL